MLPWLLLGTARVPGERELMRLFRRGDEFSIRVGNYELMNNRVHGSEDALASLVCARLSKAAPRVLIGGLGMGFTLATVLREVDAKAEVVVAELIPEVVEWNRGPIAHVAGHPLRDRRVRVHAGDVAEAIRGAHWDAIVLDVDNGPAALTAQSNNWLYTPEGLRATREALGEGGVYALWSEARDAKFTARLQRAGFTVEEIPVRGREGSRGPRYFIWLARTATGARSTASNR